MGQSQSSEDGPRQKPLAVPGSKRTSRAGTDPTLLANTNGAVRDREEPFYSTKPSMVRRIASVTVDMALFGLAGHTEPRSMIAPSLIRRKSCVEHGSVRSTASRRGWSIQENRRAVRANRLLK